MKESMLVYYKAKICSIVGYDHCPRLHHQLCHNFSQHHYLRYIEFIEYHLHCPSAIERTLQEYTNY